MQTDAHVPVAGADGEHAADAEKVVDGVVGVDRPRAAHGDHRRADFAVELAAIDAGDESGPVNQCLDLRSDVGKVGGGSDDDAIGMAHLLDPLIHGIGLANTAPVRVVDAFHAGHAAAHAMPADLDHLGLDAGLVERLEDSLDECGGVAVAAGTTVEGDDVHSLGAPHSSGSGAGAARSPSRKRSSLWD